MGFNNEPAAVRLGGRIHAAGGRDALRRRHQAGSHEQYECEIHKTEFYLRPETC
jgi:hypothetical protein